MKKFPAIIIACLLMVLSLPLAVHAATDISKEDAVKAEVRRIYTKCQETAQMESFDGYCGLMTSHQLWHLGINDTLGPTYDGNKQFDRYSEMSVTSGGYRVTAYPAQEYTLDQALSAITRGGTQDAENILVGFEATNTEAGSVYGHAMVIHTIMDGKVYFVENYSTYIAGAEGNVIVLTIPEFVSFYEGWTTLDGVIHFGNRRYSDSCQSFATDLFLRARFGSSLRSEPCLLGENDSTRLRSVTAGELLHATAVYMNNQGERFYRIDDGEQIGYVTANAVSLVSVSEEALRGDNISLSSSDEDGILLSGKVIAQYGNISAIRMTLTDEEKNPVREAQLDVVGSICDLALLNEQLAADTLESGEYTLQIFATAACVSVRGNGLVTQFEDYCLYTHILTPGKTIRGVSAPVKGDDQVRNGWFLKEGVRYFYRADQPCKGWVTYLGVDYYLQDNGAVTTGLADVDGWLRYFSATGALCVGWVTAGEATYYWQPDGTLTTGLQQIDGKLYCFDEQGVLMKNTTAEIDSVTYQIDADGVATENG